MIYLNIKSKHEFSVQINCGPKNAMAMNEEFLLKHKNHIVAGIQYESDMNKIIAGVVSCRNY